MTLSRRAALFAALTPCLSPWLARAQTPDATTAPAITGTGATFPAQVYQQWAEDHSRQTGVRVTYQPAGSSAGVRAITEGRVDFGASDVPLSAAELDKRRLFQFPTLVGGIVPFVNLPGVGPGALRLDPPTLAALWAGRITRWNDPALRALNPELALPALPVRRVVRSDGSGTTTVFVQYLRQAASDVAQPIVPDGGRANWPGEVEAVDGSKRLVAAVRATPGAIGYVSSDYTLRDRLAGVSLLNPRGGWVAPELPAFKAAIGAAGLFRQSLEPVSLLGVDGVGVWPIVTATYVLVSREPASLARASQTLRFFYQSFLLGDRAVAGTGFAPLPITTQARIVALLSGFRTLGGQPVPLFLDRPAG